jgi:hypothetical protein
MHSSKLFSSFNKKTTKKKINRELNSSLMMRVILEMTMRLLLDVYKKKKLLLLDARKPNTKESLKQRFKKVNDRKR